MTKKEEVKKPIPKVKGINLEDALPKEPARAGASVDKDPTRIMARRPAFDMFFRAHPERKIMADIYEDRDENKTYLIGQKVVDHLPVRMTKRVDLYLCVNRRNVPFLFPVPLADVQGRRNTWYESMEDVVIAAREQWIRMESETAIGGYNIIPARNYGDVEPEWPEWSDEVLLAKAFGRSYINSLDHVVVKRLNGEL